MTETETVKKLKKPKKAKLHDQRGKDRPDVVATAEAIIEQVKTEVNADHELGHKVKELRDKGMAWWAIGHELNLPGSGPNVASGKGGASRARTAYKKTFGTLPGDVVARTTKAARTAANEDSPTERRKCAIPEEELADDTALVAAVQGKHIRWLGSTPYGFGPGAIVTEREARVHPENITVADGPNGPVLHFREMDLAKKDRRAEQWRSVYAADIYDIRR